MHSIAARLHRGRREAPLGVWSGPGEPRRWPGESAGRAGRKQKLAREIRAIGVRLSRWVTMHGFAFNVSTDLDRFRPHRRCGISSYSVTSLVARSTSRPPGRGRRSGERRPLRPRVRGPGHDGDQPGDRGSPQRVNYSLGGGGGFDVEAEAIMRRVHALARALSGSSSRTLSHCSRGLVGLALRQQR